MAVQVEIPGPKYEYTYQIKKHGVVAGASQSWIVTVTVTNTSKQIVKDLDLSVRCFQVNKGNEVEREARFTALEPGERLSRDLTFNLYNPQYGGATAMPDARVREVKLDW
jgi:hypothetical protein